MAAGAYLRGGVYLGSNCIVGPSCEVKSSFMLGGSKRKRSINPTGLKNGWRAQLGDAGEQFHGSKAS